MTGASWICLCSAPSPSRSSGAARSLRTLLNLVGHKPNRSEEHTSELQSQSNLVCRLLLEKKILLALGAAPKAAHTRICVAVGFRVPQSYFTVVLILVRPPVQYPHTRAFYYLS